MSFIRSIFGIALLAGLFLAAGHRCALADEIVNVSVNTAAANAGPGQAELLFSLIDGSVAGDGNNTAMLSNLSFGSGASLDAALTMSNVTGTLGTGVSFSDTMFDSTVGILFNPGSTVSFLLDLTTNSDAGGTPDTFSFVMFDTNGNPIATADPSGANSVVNFTLDGANTTMFTDSAFATVTPAGVPTPEPGTLMLLGSSLIALIGAARKRKLQ